MSKLIMKLKGMAPLENKKKFFKFQVSAIPSLQTNASQAAMILQYHVGKNQLKRK